MNFKNMKIPVENNLDEIVATLESKGWMLGLRSGIGDMLERKLDICTVVAVIGLVLTTRGIK